MKKKKTLSKIIYYEVFGFAAILVLFWLNETIDLPHRVFGAPATPINLTECIIESVILAFGGALVIFYSYRLIKRIKYLEGFLHVCAYCRKINVDGEWIQMETFIEQRSDAHISHSFCPECFEKHFSKY